MIPDEVMLPWVPWLCSGSFLAFSIWSAWTLWGGYQMGRRLEAGQREEARQKTMWNLEKQEVLMIHHDTSLPSIAETAVQKYVDEGAAAEHAWRETPTGKTYTRHKLAIAAARRLYELGDTSVGRAYVSRWSYEFAREVRYAWDLEES